MVVGDSAPGDSDACDPVLRDPIILCWRSKRRVVLGDMVMGDSAPGDSIPAAEPLGDTSPGETASSNDQGFMIMGSGIFPIESTSTSTNSQSLNPDSTQNDESTVWATLRSALVISPGCRLDMCSLSSVTHCLRRIRPWTTAKMMTVPTRQTKHAPVTPPTPMNLLEKESAMHSVEVICTWQGRKLTCSGSHTDTTPESRGWFRRE